MSYTYDFVAKDGTLTGKIHSSMFGESEVLDGRIDDDKVTFVEIRRMPPRRRWTAIAFACGVHRRADIWPLLRRSRRAACSREPIT
jgi:hypothetical protein